MLNEPKTANFQEDAVTVVIAPVAALVREGLKTLDRAKAMVSASPDIMGGAACFSGMRIPVHDLADMVTNGDTSKRSRRPIRSSRSTRSASPPSMPRPIPVEAGRR